MKLSAAVSVLSLRFARIHSSLFLLVSACVTLAALAGLPPSSAQAQSVSLAPLQTTFPASGLFGPYGVAIDGAGNVYIADQYNRRVVELPASGAPQTVLPFSGFQSFLRAVAVDKQGDVFGASFTSSGGILLEIPAGCGSSSCQVSIPISGMGVPGGLALDSAGDIFISDYSHSSLLEWLANCSANCQVTVATGLTAINGLTVDAAGNIFATVLSSIEKMPLSGGVYGSPTTVVTGLQGPTGVAIDAAGNLFIADQSKSQIVEVPSGCGSSSCWVMLGSGLTSPDSVAVDSKGNVFAAELTSPGVVVEIASIAPNFGYVNVGSNSTLTLTYNINDTVTLGASPSVVTQGVANLDFTLSGTPTCAGEQTAPTTCTVAVQFAPLAPGLRQGAVELHDSGGNLLVTTLVRGFGSAPQVAFPGGPEINLNHFAGPTGVLADAAGNVFFPAYASESSQYGYLVEIPVGCTNTSCYTSRGGTEYFDPGQPAMDGAGTIYVPNGFEPGTVYVVPSTCNSTSCTTTISTGAADPAAVALDGAGDIFVSDNYNGGHVNEVRVVGGTTTVGKNTDGPSGVALDATGNIYVANTLNGVDEIPAVGLESRFASWEGDVFSVATDAAGDVYVNPASEIIEVPLGCASSSCDIQASLNNFNYINGLGFDNAGNLFIADVNGSRLDEVQRSQAPTLSFATTNVGSNSSSNPLTVMVQNIGNQPLTFSGFAASTNFTWDSGSTTCSTSEPLAPGGTCVVGADFSPTTGGSLTGTLTITDNTLNGSAATQQVPLTGTAIVPPVVVTRFIDNATTLPLEGTDNFLVYVQNTNTVTDSSLTATVTLPAGLTYVSSTGGSCGVTPTASGNTVTLSGISLGSGAACQNGMVLQAIALGAQTASTVATADGATSSPYTTSVTVYDVPASLSITGAPLGTYLGGQFSFTVTALDPLGSPDAAYAGTVAFTSTDSAATLPGAYTFQPSDAGSHTFNLTLNTIGSQTVTATDSADSLSISTGGIQVSIPSLQVTLATDDDPAVATNCYTPPGSGTGGAGSGKFPNCTLRDALAAASAIGSGNIAFDPTVFKASNSAADNTITLGTAGTLNIPPNTTVTGRTTGSGATLTNLVTVSGNAAFTVFSVQSGVNAAALTSLNIVDGLSGGGGGGIVNSGALTITGCTISGNSAASTRSAYGVDGGGIANGGTLSVVNSTISGNSAIETGAAATAQGGGINNSGTLTVTGSTISGNQLTVSTNLVDSDAAFGAGIYNQGTATLSDTTITGNTSTAAEDGSFGGGIYTVHQTKGMLNLTNSTVLGNSADFGADIFSLTATINLANSIVGHIDNDGGTENNNGGNQVNAGSINLATLGSYGGTTQTMLPLPDSSAICAGLASNDTSASIATDQRGLPLDPNCPAGTVDAGAVQSNYAMSFSTQPPAATPPTVAMNPGPALQVTESGNPVAGGIVSIAGSTWPIGGTTTAPISGGTATFANLIPTSLTTGETLVATLSLNPALSPALSLTATSNGIHVTRDTQTITFTPITGPNYVSGSVALSATASSGLTVTFASLTSATCTVSGSSASLIASGNCIIQAEQAGGGAYAPAPNVPQTFFVSRVAQTISFPAIANNQVVNTSIPLAATATSGLAVTFTSYTPSTCTVSNASGWTASFVGYGSCTLVAQQAGGGEYASAPNVEQILFVHHVSQTITFPAIANTQVVNTSIPLSATSTSGLAVSFSSTTPSTCTVAGTTASLTASGSCTLEASQAGNGVYAAAQVVSQTIFVHHLSQSIAFTPIVNDQLVNTTIPLSATATSGLAVSFVSTTPSTCTVSSAGGWSASLIASGSCTLEAEQAGNSIYGAAPTVTQAIFVHHLTQTISFTPITGSQNAGSSITLSATASSGLTVTFSSSTPSTCTVSGSTASLNSYGDCTIEAAQAGNSTYGSAPSVSQTVFIHHLSQTISFPAIGGQVVGTPLSLSATASSGLTVGFASTTTGVCTVSGTTASFLAAGTCTIQASQAGNGVYSGAATVAQSFAVTE